MKAVRWLQRPRVAAGVTFAISLVLAGMAVAWQIREDRAVAEDHFDEDVRLVTDLIATRLRTYEYGLRGARGAVLAAGIDQFDRQRYQRYSESRDIDVEFPGARGIGVIWRVARADEATFLAAARRDDMPDFAIHELAPHTGERYIIQYVEPVARNRQAVGLDIASEANRRTAAEVSMRSGAATLSGPITLVQATGQPLHSFLLMLPIYRPGIELVTEQDRETATLGWAYAPLVIDEVLKGLDWHDQEHSLTLRDITATSTEPFFTTLDTEAAAAGGLVRRITIPIFGRSWQAEISAKPAYVRTLHQYDPRMMVLVGIAVAALLALMAYMWAQSAQRRLQLRAEQLRRAAILESSSDAIIATTPDDIVTDWNQGAQRLFGYTLQQAVGRTAASLVLPDDRQPECANNLAAAASGETIPVFESRLQTRAGAEVDASIAISPIIGHDGSQIGLSATIRDISLAKAAERRVQELNESLESQVVERTAKLQAARRDLQNILDAMPSMIGYWDQKLVNVVANRAYQHWYGINPESLRGKHIRELFGEADYEFELPYLQAALQGHVQVFERSLAKPDGSGSGQFLVRYLPDLVDGEVRGFYALMHDISEVTESRQRLATALRENEALLSTIHLHALFSVTDQAGRITEVNDNFCAITGYSRDELLGQNHRIVNSGVQSRDFWVEMWRTISSGKPWHGEICNRAKNGSLYWVDSIIVPYHGENGRIEKYISIRTDITASKLAKQKLRLSEAFLERAGEIAGVGGWEVDLRTQAVHWAAQTYRIHEVDPGYQPNYDDALAFYPSEARLLIERAVSESTERGTEWDLEVPFVTAKGRAIWVRVVGKAEFADGAPVKLVGAVQDITMRRQLESQLKRTNERFALAADGAGIGVWELDLSSNVITGDARMFQLFGQVPTVDGEAPLSLWHRALHPDDRERYEQMLVDAQHGECEFDIEFRIVLPGGEIRHLKAAGHVQRNTNGKPVRMAGVNFDITERKTVEEEVHKANVELESRVRDRTQALRATNVALESARADAEQASRAKTSFLATMSHEIRTPMNGMIGMLEVLAKDDKAEDREDLIATMRSSGFSLLHIIDDILDFSKIEAGRMELERTQVDLPKLVEDLCRLLVPMAAGQGVRVNMFIDPDLPERVWADPTRLGQVLKNLMSNAIKFSGGRADKPGRVSIRIEAGTAPQQLMFRIADNGIGIAAQILPTLFTSFTQAEETTTRRFGGSGLGLAICKRLVELMGGTITVDSTPGSGSTFSVVLAFEPVADAAHTPTVNLSGLACILVDAPDLPVNDLRRYLLHAGARVQVTHKLPEAAQLAAGHELVVIVQQVDDALAADATRAAFAAFPDVHQLLLMPEQHVRHAELASGMLAIDANVLSRTKFLWNVAVAAGRASPELARVSFDDAAADFRRAAPGLDEARSQGRLILVAEDDAINQKVILRQLGLLGYAAEMASDGVEALRLWREGGYALLLSDLHMPRMDGHTLAKAIRSEETAGTRMPIIALTANAMQGEANRAHAAGMDEYLTKPVLLDLLRAALEKWMPATDVSLSADTVLPESHEGQLAVLDVAVLERLIGDDPQIIAEFLRDYLESARRLVAQIRLAANTHDAAQAGACAHKLKSSSRSVGALLLGDLCAELENSSCAGEHDAVDKGVTRIEAAMLDVVAKIEVALAP